MGTSIKIKGIALFIQHRGPIPLTHLMRNVIENSLRVKFSSADPIVQATRV